MAVSEAVGCDNSAVRSISHINSQLKPTMKFSAAFLALTVASASAFAPATPAARTCKSFAEEK